MTPPATTEPAGLAGWLEATPATELLPARHAAEASRVVGGLRLVDALALPHAVVVAVARDGAGVHYPLPLVSDGRGSWRRAAAGDGAAATLVAHLTDPANRGRSGEFDVLGWVDGSAAGVAGQRGERSLDVDQTNESLVVDERVVVKWTVRTGLDPAPAPARLAALVSAGFTGTPRPWGLLTWRGTLVASAVDFLPGAVDGWEWAVEDVRALSRNEISLEEASEPAASIGTLVARMHRALPRRGAATAEDATLWHDRASAELETAVTLVDGAEGERLRQNASALRAVLAPLATAVGTPLLEAHGDLHVGQVLRWRPEGTGDVAYSVTDFDGNPVLSGAERAAAAPAAADVAGLVQSLDHVGRVVVHHTPDVDPAVVEAWIVAAQRELLRAYRAVDAADTGVPGEGPLLDVRLLTALRTRQLVREYLYAVRHLPHWRYVPDTALPALVAAGRTEGAV